MSAAHFVQIINRIKRRAMKTLFARQEPCDKQVAEVANREKQTEYINLVKAIVLFIFTSLLSILVAAILQKLFH